VFDRDQAAVAGHPSFVSGGSLRDERRSFDSCRRHSDSASQSSQLTRRQSKSASLFPKHPAFASIQSASSVGRRTQATSKESWFETDDVRNRRPLSVPIERALSIRLAAVNRSKSTDDKRSTGGAASWRQKLDGVTSDQWTSSTQSGHIRRSVRSAIWTHPPLSEKSLVHTRCT
jgi:hypothetical protein